MRKTMFLLVFLVLMLGMFTPIWANTVTIGSGTQTTYYLPLHTNYGYTYSQQIYTPTQVTMGGTIDRIRFYKNSGSTSNSSAWVLYMGHTTKTAFNSTTDWEALANLTQVFNGSVTIPSAEGWVEIILQTPFVYNGTQNLIVALDENQSGYGTSVYWRQFTSIANTSIYYYSDGTNPNPASPPTAIGRQGFVNQIQLDITPAGGVDNPTNFSASGASPTQIDLGWTPNAGSDPVMVAWNSVNTFGTPVDGAVYDTGANNAIAGGGTVIYNGSGTSFQHTGLSALTQYFYKAWSVGDDGRATEYSPGVSANAYTLVAPAAIPYSQNFDGTWIGTPAAPLGWKVVNANSDGYTWNQANTYISPTHSTPYSAHGMGNTNDYLITLPLNLSGINARLKWWDKVESASYANSYRVLISTTNDEVASFTTELGSFTCTNTAWTEHQIDLSGYNGQTVYLAFYQYASASTYFGFGIDDVLIEEIPQVPVFSISPASRDFGTVNLGSSLSQTFTVTNTGGGSLGIASIALDPATDHFGIANNTYSAPLGANQSFTFDVVFAPEAAGTFAVTLRVTDDQSREAHDIALTGTGYDPTKPVPYTQDFNGGTSLTAIEWAGTMSIYANHGSSSSNGLAFNLWSSATSCNASTPPIGPLSATCELNFDYRIVNYTGYPSTATTLGASDNIQVQISTDNGVNYSTEYTINSGNHTPGTQFASVTVPLTAYAGETVKARFLCTWGSGDYYVDIDNFRVRETPSVPVFSISPASWDFGMVELGQSALQQFTVTNTGSGLLGIEAVSISGADAEMFRTVNNTYTSPLGQNESFTFDVEFTPFSAVQYVVTLTVEDDQAKAAHDVQISGEGYLRPAGSTCGNPYPVSLPLVGFTGDTSLYGDDYSSTWITPNSNYLNGDDMVLSFTLDFASTLAGSLASTDGGTWIGMFVLASEPNATTPATVLRSATTSGSSVTMTPVDLQAGTYFLIISTYPDPQAFEFSLDLSATPLPTDPEFAIDPANWDFGSLQINTQSSRVFTVTNTGGGTLFIDMDDVAIAGANADQFTLDPLAQDISLDTNETAQITVRFAPTSTGAKSAALQIVDNVAGGKTGRRDAAKATRTVALSGEGIDSTVYEFPLDEGAEGASFPPAGWVAQKTGGTSAGLWTRVLTGTYPDCLPRNGSAMAMFNCFSYQSGTSGILATAPLSFGAGDYQVEFWMYRDGGYPSNADRVNVYYNTQQNLTGATLLGTVNRSLGLAPAVDEAGWYSYTFPIPNAKGKAIGFIVFEGVSAYGNNIFVDDIKIGEEPSTPVELSSFTALVTSENFVNLSWVTQSETGVQGYHIYRSTSSVLSNALAVSPLIESLNSLEQQVYQFTDTELYEDGTYYYWLECVDFGGDVYYHGPVSVFYTTADDDPVPEIPLFTQLQAVYPNPFNPVAYIPFSIAEAAEVNFRIYNSRGQLLRSLDLGTREPGYHRIVWDGTDANGKACGNGVYYFIMNAGKDSFQRKAVLLK